MLTYIFRAFPAARSGLAHNSNMTVNYQFPLIIDACMGGSGVYPGGFTDWPVLFTDSFRSHLSLRFICAYVSRPEDSLFPIISISTCKHSFLQTYELYGLAVIEAFIEFVHNICYFVLPVYIKVVTIRNYIQCLWPWYS